MLPPNGTRGDHMGYTVRTKYINLPSTSANSDMSQYVNSDLPKKLQCVPQDSTVYVAFT